MKWKASFLILPILFVSLNSFGQQYSISGFIEDAETGERLNASTIALQNSARGAVANAYGFYSLLLEKDSVRLIISYVGYKTKTLRFYHDKDTTLNVKLKPNLLLETVEVKANQNNFNPLNALDALTISSDKIKHTPALLGEPDVLKVLQLLPGIQAGNEGQSGLYVRGGSPDQNLILLDGVPVYNASHLFGFFSVFNPETIKNVKLYKGNIPAQYGGRLSSAVDITLKEGNLHKWTATAKAGIVTSSLNIEGPIVKDKVSILLAGRRTFIDVFAKDYIEQFIELPNSRTEFDYFFHDLTFKVNAKLSQKDRIYASLYTGKDDYFRADAFDRDTALSTIGNGLAWSNLTSTLRWNRIWNDKLFSNLTLTYGEYNYQTIQENSYRTLENAVENVNSESGVDFSSSIKNIGLSLHFDYNLSSNQHAKFGINAIRHDIKPGRFRVYQYLEGSNSRYMSDTTIRLTAIQAFEISTYVEDNISLTKWAEANIGIRLNAYSADDAFYTTLRPRLSLGARLPWKFSTQISYVATQQFLHLLSNNTGLPTDLWLSSTEQIEPQTGWQTTAKISRPLGNVQISLEGFYRKMADVVAFRPGSIWYSTPDWQEQIIQGEGEAYGVELFVQKDIGRFTGWMSYTWSRSFRRFNELNFGEKFPFRFNRIHDYSLSVNYQIDEKLSLAGNWIFSTGQFLTLPNTIYNGLWVFQSIERPIRWSQEYYDGRNNFQTSNYHRLDLNINYSWLRKRWQSTISAGAYNVYNRRNPYYISIQREPHNRRDGDRGFFQQIQEYSLLPMIPFVSYKLQFSP